MRGRLPIDYCYERLREKKIIWWDFWTEKRATTSQYIQKDLNVKMAYNTNEGQTGKYYGYYDGGRANNLHGGCFVDQACKVWCLCGFPLGE